jgi:hypothetical protein
VLTARTNAVAAVLELASRLAEEYDTVPLPMVSRAVKAAAEAARLFGEDVVAALPTIERIAREDLQALRESSPVDVPA